MPISIEKPMLRTRESPREILSADFKSLRQGLPIRGGWGYSIEEAVIIDRDDPTVSKSIPFDGVGIEYAFVEKRVFEELIIFRPEQDRFSGIEWNLLSQRLTHVQGRAYDHLTFEVTAFRDRDWGALRAEWEGPEGHGSSKFDSEAHAQKRESLMCKYTTEYWFDITSFYGH